MTDFSNPNEAEKEPSVKAREIFQLLCSSFGSGNNSDFMKLRYVESENELIAYYTAYYEMQNEIHKLKEKHKRTNNELRSEIIMNGFPLAMFNYVYRRFKADAGLLKCTHEDEAQFFSDMYNEIKEELISYVGEL